MNKLIALSLMLSARAFADPAPAPNAVVVSPWGSSPYVVPYQPPPKVARAHRGLTLEVALGAGSTSVDASAGGVTFAIGVWLTRDAALAFRVTDVGAYGFLGASIQYYATHSLWLGTGIGGLSERGMDEFGGTTRTSGTGGFARIGYELVDGDPHALYLSAEVQAGSVADQSRGVALIALGYQML